MADKFIFIPSTGNLGPDLQPLSPKDLQTRDQLVREVTRILHGNKQASQTTKGLAHQTMATTVGTATNKHNVLWTYEKAILQAGQDWATACNALQQYCADRTHRSIWVSEFLGSMDPARQIAAPRKRRITGPARGPSQLSPALPASPSRGNPRGTAVIEGLLNPEELDPPISAEPRFVRLGTVFLGDARFTELRPQPLDSSGHALPNKVYVLGRIVYDGSKNPKLVQDPDHTNAHFVYLPNSDTYARRFVTRGLNHNDIINIKANQPLGSPVTSVLAQRQEVRLAAPGPRAPVRVHNQYRKQLNRHQVTTGSNLTEIQQILSHTRGWQKRYISTGVSDKSVFSTRGAQFVSLYGTALIDLAALNLATVFDLHNPLVVKKYLRWNPDTVVTATGPGNNATNLAEEQFLALRDVLRTRELLIKFAVPHNALRCTSGGDRILGYGTNDFNGPGRILQAVQLYLGTAPMPPYDALNYQGWNNRYWLFLLFPNAGAAANFLLNFNAGEPVQAVTLTRYDMPTTLAGWK